MMKMPKPDKRTTGMVCQYPADEVIPIPVHGVWAPAILAEARILGDWLTFLSNQA